MIVDMIAVVVSSF